MQCKMNVQCKMNKNIGTILFLLSGLSIKISILKNSRYNTEYKYTLLKKGMSAAFTYNEKTAQQPINWEFCGTAGQEQWQNIPSIVETLLNETLGDGCQ